MAAQTQIAPFIYHAREFSPGRQVRVWDGAGQRLAFGLWHVRHGTVSIRKPGHPPRHLRPGSCGISEPGTVAQLGTDSQGVLVVFDIATRRRARRQRRDGHYFLRDTDPPQPDWSACFGTALPLPVAPTWYRETVLLCDHIRHDYWRCDAARRECNARLHHWLARYARGQGEFDAATRPQDLAEQVEAIIHDSSHAKLTVDDLARLTGTSASTIHRAYAARFGHGPRRGLELRRMEKAMRYLREGDLTVDVIAHHVGYTDHASFTRAFRRCVGSTPSDWRRT